MLAEPSGRRPPGMWRSPSRPPAVVVHLAGGPHAHTCGMAPVVVWYLLMSGSVTRHVHFGLLKPNAFIPCFRNGPIGPKGPYPNQTKKSGERVDEMGPSVFI